MLLLILSLQGPILTSCPCLLCNNFITHPDDPNASISGYLDQVEHARRAAKGMVTWIEQEAQGLDVLPGLWPDNDNVAEVTSLQSAIYIKM